MDDFPTRCSIPKIVLTFEKSNRYETLILYSQIFHDNFGFHVSMISAYSGNDTSLWRASLDENNRYEMPEPNRAPRGIGFAIFMVFCAFTYGSSFVLWLLDFNVKFIIIFLLATPVLMVIALIVVFLVPDGPSPADFARRESRRRRANNEDSPGSRPGSADKVK